MVAICESVERDLKGHSISSLAGLYPNSGSLWLAIVSDEPMSTGLPETKQGR